MDVVYLTTASQVFHRLRLQALSRANRPLIVFTPKRMLQHAGASSTLDDLCDGRFREILAAPPPERAKQLLLCCGQVAAELESERKTRQAPAAIARLERLYPFPRDALERLLADHAPGIPVTWVQEEPENMGPWRWLRPQLEELLEGRVIRCVARPERVSPATGSMAIHQREQRHLLDTAFCPPD